MTLVDVSSGLAGQHVQAFIGLCLLSDQPGSQLECSCCSIAF